MWMCNVRCEDIISPEELRSRLKLKSIRNDGRMEECVCLVNVEPSRLLIVSTEYDLGKHGMR